MNAKLVFLGTADAVSYPDHENSFFVLADNEVAILVDCSARPLRRLEDAGVDFHLLSDLIITHFHPDHVSGLATLIMEMWLLNRKKPLTIHGCDHAISRAIQMLELFGWQDWNGIYPVQFNSLPLEERIPVLERGNFKIWSSPVKHMIPTIGIRVEYGDELFVAAYSSDTKPVPEMERLAAGADVLIHEAAGTTHFHSTPSQAGEIAARAGVKSLYLTHYPPESKLNEQATLDQAKKTFSGKVYLAQDLMEIPFRRE
jgi:ribonuclease Z